MSRRRPPTLKLLTIAILAVLPVLSAHAIRSRRIVAATSNAMMVAMSAGRQNPRSSLSDAVRRVERDTRGEVLSAERVQYDGRDMHRVKVVDDQGRVRVFMQDPQRRSDSGNAPSPPRNGSGGSQRQPPPARGDDD